MSDIQFSPTPWDTRILGKESFQVSLKENYDLALINSEIESLSRDNYYFVRFDSSDMILKKVFSKHGFYLTEHSAEMLCTDVKKALEHSRFKKKIDIGPSDYSSADKDAIRRAVSLSFKHGRIDEDPFIEESVKIQRRENWVNDLMDKKVPVLVFRDQSKIRSFMFYTQNDSSVELILGGSDEESGVYTPFFWYSVFSHFYSLGITRIKTRISLANTVILNLYIQFNFKVMNSEYVYAR